MLKKFTFLAALLLFIKVGLAQDGVIFNQGFEGDNIPAGWLVVDEDNDNITWGIDNNDSNSGNKCAGIGASTLNHKDWLISPEFTLKKGATIDFYARTRNALSKLEGLEVFVLKEGQDITKAKYKMYANYSVPKVWSEEYIDFEEHLSGAGIKWNDKVCIAIKAVTKGGNYLLIDDLVVNHTPENAKPYVYPTKWEATGKTNETSTSSKIHIYNMGLAPLTVSAVTDLSDSPFSCSLDASNIGDVNVAYGNESYALTFSINSATAGTFNKDFEVTTNGGKITFTLSAQIASNGESFNEFSSNFDSGLPLEMTVLDANNDKLTFVASDKKPRNGSGKSLASVRPDNTEVTADDYLISPKMNVGESTKLTFYTASSYPKEWAAENFDILVSKSGKTAADFTIKIAENIKSIGTEYIRHEYNLNDNTEINKGDKVYVAIKHKSPGFLKRSLYIDDYSIISENKDTKAYITSATFANEVFDYTIDNENKTIKTIVNKNTNLSAYTPVFNVSEGASITPTGAQDFSASAVTYSVTSKDKSTTNNYSVSIAKEAEAVASLVEGFDGEEIPANWKVIDNNKDQLSWSVSKANNHGAAGSNSLYLNSGSSDLTHDDYIIAPHISVKENSTFNFFAKSYNKTGESFKVLASKTGAHASDFTIELGSLTVNDQWEEKSILLAENANISAGDEIYIAIKGMNTAPVKLIIDDFKLSQKGGLEILAFTFPEIEGTARINNDNHTIEAISAFGTDLTTITPVITATEGAVITPNGVQNFKNGPVNYSITLNSKTVTYAASITKAQNPFAEIIDVTIDDQMGSAIINSDDATVKLNVSNSTDLAAIAPTITISENASINPGSGITKDFSNGPIKYVVTAENGTKKNWTIEVYKELSLSGLTEGFEFGKIPAGWRVINSNADKRTWKVGKNYKYEGEYGIGIFTNANQVKDDWLILPKVKVSATDILSLMVRSTAPSYPEDFDIMVSKSGPEVDNFTIKIAEVRKAKTSAYGTDFFPYVYVLTDIDGIDENDDIYIGIHAITKDGSGLFIDNISVAPAPTSAEASLNKESSFQITEVNKTTTTKKIFELSNTLASTLTIDEIAGLDGTSFSTSIEKDKVELKPNEKYAFSITYAPTTEGDHTATLVLKTNGGNVSLTLNAYAYKQGAYFESFENEKSIKYWVNNDNDGDGNGFFLFKNTEKAITSHSGESCMLSASAFYPSTILKPDNFFITPKLSVKKGDKLVFWAGEVMTGLNFKENLSVMVSTTKNKPADFKDYLLKNEKIGEGYTKFELDLSKYVGQNIFIAFRHHNVTDQAQLKLDDVVLPGLYVPTKPDLVVKYKKPKYPIIPASQKVAPLEAQVVNLGAELNVATDLTFNIAGGNFTEAHALEIPMEFEDQKSFETKKEIKKLPVGEYNVNISVDNEEDEDKDNNSISYKLKVDRNELALETGNVDNFFSYQGKGGKVGQIFEIKEKDILIGVRAFLYEPVAGNTLQFELRQMGTQQGYPKPYPVKLIGKTTPTKINSDKSGWYEARFNKPIHLEAGKFFLCISEIEGQAVAIGNVSDYYTPENIYFQAKGDDNWHIMDIFNEDPYFTLTLRALFDKTIGQEEVMTVGNLEIAPNPANNSIKINATDNGNLQIIDQLGRVIISENIIAGNNTVNTENLENGTYIVKLISENKQKVQKLIINH
ncbi:MAG: choice-of-anchor J domain-containing protein [Bacteroidales bacterium]